MIPAERFNVVRKPFHPAERDALVAAALKTPEGRERIRRAIELAAARAADSFAAESVGEAVARTLAGLKP